MALSAMDKLSFGAMVAAAIEEEGSVEEEEEEMPLLFRAFDAKSGDEETKDVLLYSSWLCCQKIFDDFRFCNHRFVEYDFSHVGGKALVAEQDFRLGKPGIGWDSAYILTEYVLKNVRCKSLLKNPAPVSSRETRQHPVPQNDSNVVTDSQCYPKLLCGDDDDDYREANSKNAKQRQPLQRRRRVVVELGCGIGTAGIALALAEPELDVFLTDLDLVLPLAAANAKLNGLPSVAAVEFNGHDRIARRGGCDDGDNCGVKPAAPFSSPSVAVDPPSLQPSAVSVSSLPWGLANAEGWVEAHLKGRATVRQPSSPLPSALSGTPSSLPRERVQESAHSHNGSVVDLVIGADLVVPGLYDHTALVETISSLRPSAALLVSRVRITNGLDPFLEKLREHFTSVSVETATESLVKHPAETQFVVVTALGHRS